MSETFSYNFKIGFNLTFVSIASVGFVFIFGFFF